jgi:hypothetical protein
VTRPPKPLFDNRQAQAERAAVFLQTNPDSTGKEIDAHCDTGSVTKLISDMLRMGYGITKAWRIVACDQGNRARRVRV